MIKRLFLSLILLELVLVVTLLAVLSYNQQKMAPQAGNPASTVTIEKAK